MVRYSTAWSSSTTRVYPPTTTPSACAASGRKRTHAESSSSDRSKRQRITSSSSTSNAFRDSRPVEVIDLTQDDDNEGSRSKSISTGTSSGPQEATAVVVPSEPVREERRARRFRTHPPRSYLEKLERATTQRMFVIGRKRKGTEEVPEEEVYMVGTTGNIYRVTIAKEPSCTCPDARKGNQCKHVVYVLVNVLKAPEHLRYQLAFLSSELREIFAKAPPADPGPGQTEQESNNRKPIEGDCPICFMEFSPQSEEIIYCRTSCGNNVHKACFEQWAASTAKNTNGVRCVYCRAPWPEETKKVDLKAALERSTVSHEGYINVAESFGLSRLRDYSTYYPYRRWDSWV
ncbi:hypothetical protein VTN31DRAFT_831 [Thermomyces dupontii]|uniref:uncharacterized protein n=1 Tax=Talaromyces thermophilus TaxID=28565 RepID=UPI0037431B8B